LDKLFNNHDIPWVRLVKASYYNNGNLPGTSVEGSFWWRAHLKLIDIYKEMAKCNLGDGKSSMFWTDNWDDIRVQHKFSSPDYLHKESSHDCRSSVAN
jgi:hypothetical protein